MENNNPYQNNNDQYNQNNNDNQYSTEERSEQEQNVNPYKDNNPYVSGNVGGGYDGNNGQNPYVNNNPYTSDNPYGGYNTYSSSSYNGYDGYIPERRERKGLGIASMVLGILSLTCCCCSILGVIVAIVGLILGIISQKAKPNGFALAGIITSAFGIAFGILGFVITIASGALTDEFWTDFYEGWESSFSSSDEFDNNTNAFMAVIKFFKHIFIK
ncbi:MAG: DUF4190 domain-containing protein [Clostridia bacterium]|nr:DUF4190 domain-containing protein [Clostridia bacterium]